MQRQIGASSGCLSMGGQWGCVGCMRALQRSVACERNVVVHTLSHAPVWAGAGRDAPQMWPRGSRRATCGAMHGGGGVYTAMRVTSQCLGVHVAGGGDDMLAQPCRHVAWPEHHGVQWRQRRRSISMEAGAVGNMRRA
jgi:hypothetical protein